MTSSAVSILFTASKFMIRIATSPSSFFWATLVEPYDSEFMLVRCVSKGELHLVKRECVR